MGVVRIGQELRHAPVFDLGAETAKSLADTAESEVASVPRRDVRRSGTQRFIGRRFISMVHRVASVHHLIRRPSGFGEVWQAQTGASIIVDGLRKGSFLPRRQVVRRKAKLDASFQYGP
jgi:hypothetical protein